MSIKKAKSFNHQVYEKAYKRLNLSATQRSVFYRLLGFLIRNDRPFPYSAVKMAELTGYSLRTIFYIFDDLEKFRLIKRHGMGKNRRFSSGTILDKIFTTVQNRKKLILVNNETTVQLVQQNSINRATSAYNKTSSLLKYKKKEPIFYDLNYQEYVGRMKADQQIGLISKDMKAMNYEEWMNTKRALKIEEVQISK